MFDDHPQFGVLVEGARFSCAQTGSLALGGRPVEAKTLFLVSTRCDKGKLLRFILYHCNDDTGCEPNGYLIFFSPQIHTGHG